jgi:hypothetical protein
MERNGHSQYGRQYSMVNRRSHGRSIEQASFGQPAFFFGDAREPLGVAVVVEDDGVDDLISRGGEIEGDLREAEESFDIRDLLLDETD